MLSCGLPKLILYWVMPFWISEIWEKSLPCCQYIHKWITRSRCIHCLLSLQTVLPENSRMSQQQFIPSCEWHVKSVFRGRKQKSSTPGFLQKFRCASFIDFKTCIWNELLLLSAFVLFHYAILFCSAVHRFSLLAKMCGGFTLSYIT